MSRSRTSRVSAHIEVLGALADPTRQQLLDLISGSGPQSASVLATQLPISRQAIVKHLRLLEDAGLVTSETQGRAVVFTIRADGSAETAEWLAATTLEWQARADRLRALAERRR